MNRVTIKTSLIAAICVVISSVTIGQHNQNLHEELVDDFYTPYPITLSELQTFTGTIGEPGTTQKQRGEGDWWDYYVFQSPGSGQVDIVLEGFSKPVNLSLEKSSLQGQRRKDTVEKSFYRFTGTHRLSAEVSPNTTYYIAVGTGALDNGFTPYELTVKFTEEKTEPASPAFTGEYALTLIGTPCAVPGSDFFSLELPVYVVSDDSITLLTPVKQDVNADKRTHEMFRFDSAHGTLVHEFSDLFFDAESALSLQRDIVVLGNFQAGKFYGEVREHDIVKDLSGSVVHERGDCSRQVTAIGH